MIDNFFNNQEENKTYILTLDEATEEDCTNYAIHKQILTADHNYSDNIKQLLSDHQIFFLDIPLIYKGY